MVRRRRGIHVLMGTLALVAGCSTGRSYIGQRAEVSGVVRDRATGRAIAGARVVGADGSLAETDAEGRFRLYVRGAQADVRISAAGHSPEHVELEGLEANVELAPIEELWGEGPSAHVVDFVEQAWALGGDAGVSVDASILHACPAPADASCATCHERQTAAVQGAILPTASVAPHDGLGGGCLACHGGGPASSSCERCHGAEAGAMRTEVAHFFAMAVSRTPDRVVEGTAFEVRSTLEVGSESAISTWARALARDRSRGAHDPRATRWVALQSVGASESPASPSSSPASASSSVP